MIVTVECVTAANAELAEFARAEAERHRPRTPERRAAAALWIALADTLDPDTARAALPGFADVRTVADAAVLLDRLLARECAVRWDGQRRTYACGNCGAVARRDVVNADPMTRTRVRRPMEPDG